MKKFELTIHLGNDAMLSSLDVARALIKVAVQMKNFAEKQRLLVVRDGIRDDNGNTVGHWKFTDDRG